VTASYNKWLWISLIVLALISVGLAMALLVKTNSDTTALAPIDSLSPTIPPLAPTTAVAALAVDKPVTATPQPDTPTAPPTQTPRPTSTLRPTSTPRPTVTPLPTATPASACPAVSGPFAALGAQLQNRLGCTQGGAYTTNAAEERFQNGRMIWREDNDRIYAFYSNGQWESHRDTWNEGDPNYSCGTPSTPPTPLRGFGRAWCNFASIRNGLGNATEGERGLGITVQNFANGAIVRTDNQTFVLYNDGSWERR
jgi:hypothetical protein